jgi:DNA-binding transcriptional LysR family regulator
MILRGLDIDDLLILSLLIDEISVTEIGDKLNLTQPAITQRLGKMRRLLGFAITIRIGRSVRLTSHGLPVAMAAREALIILLRSLPDGFSDWRRNVLVHYILSKRGDRCANESYDS